MGNLIEACHGAISIFEQLLERPPKISREGCDTHGWFGFAGCDNEMNSAVLFVIGAGKTVPLLGRDRVQFAGSDELGR